MRERVYKEERKTLLLDAPYVPNDCVQPPPPLTVGLRSLNMRDSRTALNQTGSAP